MNVRIEGMENVSSMLNKFGSEFAEKVSRGLAQGCKIVEGDAKANCPVSTEETRPGGPHGELRESITSAVEDMRGEVGTNKEYGMYVELGTWKMRAQPFLVPALQNNKDAIISAIKAAVK